MKLLLTGATGFVGRNLLLKALEDARYKTIYVPVRSIDKLKAQFEGDGFDGIPTSVKPIVTSAPEWGGMDEALDADHVVHSAGVIFARTREEYFKTNVDGTTSLLARLENPQKIIVLSSQSATGPCASTEMSKSESCEDSPVTWYGQSKLEMEKRIARDLPHLNYLSLRPPMIFGPRDSATLPLFKMVRRPFHFKPGFRSKRYSFISVGDLVRAIFAALDSSEDWRSLSKRHFFVASDKFVTDRELISGAAKAGGHWGLLITIPQPILWGLSRVIDTIPTWRATIPNLSVDRAKEIWPDRWVVSSNAFQEKFRWKPVEDFGAALKATRDWYVKTGQLS